MFRVPNLCALLGVDDLVYIEENSKDMLIAIRRGDNTWTDGHRYAGPDCLAAGIRFADMDGDGVDDLWCLDAAGNTNIYRTVVGVGTPQPLGWATTANIDMGGRPGFPRSRVRIADIDGDGRADYLIIHNNGNIEGWRSGGVGDYVEMWQHLGIVSSGKSFADLDGIRFVDINGDGRSDLMWVSDRGQVTTWINQRGFSTGSLAPAWKPAGITHTGDVTTGMRNRVTFANVWYTGNTPWLAGESPRKDYITFRNETENVFTVHENQGAGGLYVNGDGVYYCDMTGDGYDDYIYISPEGDVTVYGNMHNPPYWTQYGVVYKLGAVNRMEVHLADFTREGRCDILLVGKEYGDVALRRNDGIKDGKFVFYDYGNAGSTAFCHNNYGVEWKLRRDYESRYRDRGVRFAHITGNPRADYLCVEKNGRITAWESCTRENG